jgi:ribonuclease PH
MTSEGKFVEVQGTAEAKPFSRETIDSLLVLAQKGIDRLFEVQKSVIESLKAGV